ncbi:hypothetical protein UFOVP151_28 [uncultured Caudovirales phage]|uniref:Conjugal transfer protein TraR n=1 Tax=uncultured Caudovirales phage TaxID=2100421 RepID=A0A6J7WBP8_9CAUD|nr:hypothetical protein UFOVP151_28 [uncultured Caudovirales phage]
MDDIDIANERAAMATDKAVDDIRRKAKLDPGTPGECELCGEYMLRLISGACAPCRDKYKLP